MVAPRATLGTDPSVPSGRLPRSAEARAFVREWPAKNGVRLLSVPSLRHTTCTMESARVTRPAAALAQASRHLSVLAAIIDLIRTAYQDSCRPRICSFPQRRRRAEACCTRRVLRREQDLPNRSRSAQAPRWALQVRTTVTRRATLLEGISSNRWPVQEARRRHSRMQASWPRLHRH